MVRYAVKHQFWENCWQLLSFSKTIRTYLKLLISYYKLSTKYPSRATIPLERKAEANWLIPDFQVKKRVIYPATHNGGHSQISNFLHLFTESKNGPGLTRRKLEPSWYMCSIHIFNINGNFAFQMNSVLWWFRRDRPARLNWPKSGIIGKPLISTYLAIDFKFLLSLFNF